MQGKAAKGGRVVEDAVAGTPKLRCTVVADPIGRHVIKPLVPGRRGHAIHVTPGVKLPVMRPQGRQSAAHAHMAPATLEAHRRFTMPERLLPAAFALARIQLQPVAEAKRGLEPAAQVFLTRERNVAALNRAQLGRAAKVAVHAKVQKAADLHFGVLRQRTAQRRSQQTQGGQTGRRIHEKFLWGIACFFRQGCALQTSHLHQGTPQRRWCHQAAANVF